MRLRQIALVAADLEGAAETLGEVLDLGAPFADPGVREFGLENAVFPVGDTFLEVVSPAREGTTAGRLLERRGGDGGYMVICQSQDAAADRARVDELGIRVVWSATLPDAGAIHLHPRDVGGAILSFDWMDPVESWKWGGPGWQDQVRTERCAEIVGAELQADDPSAMSTRWAAACGAEARDEGGGAFRLDFDEGGFVRFHAPRDDRGEGVSGLVVRVPPDGREAILASARSRGLATGTDSVELLGVRLGFAPA